MKKIQIALLVAIFSVFIACQKAQESSPNAVISEEDLDCLVSIVPTGEITITETPLTKSGERTDDIYCVQIYQGTTPFTMGYFDNLEDMKLYLKKGEQYRIIVCMIKNAKFHLGERYHLTQNSINNYVSNDSDWDVFDLYFYSNSYGGMYYGNRYSSSSGNSACCFPINFYQYGFKKRLQYYSNSSASSASFLYSDSQGPVFRDIEHAKLNLDKYPTCTDWFYGEINNYTPSGDYENADLSFKRVGFQLKYELSGVTDGEVTVKIYNETRTFIDNTTTTSTYSSDTQFIAFYDAKSAWQYADHYSENMTVSVVWKRGIGVTQDLGSKTIQIKRNCLNNVKILLGNDDRGAGMNFSVEADDSMNAASTDIPVS